MTTTCKQCARYESKLKSIHDTRNNFWRRGILTDEASEQLTSEERRTAQEFSKHQAQDHAETMPARPDAA